MIFYFFLHSFYQHDSCTESELWDQNLTVNNDVNPINSENTVIEVRNVDMLDEDTLNRLITEASTIYEVISIKKGDFVKRTYSTKLRATPKDEDVKYMNSACEQLVIKMNLISVQDIHLLLWRINCVVYSVIVAWIKVNEIKGMECVNTATKNNKLPSTSPRWLRAIHNS